MGGQKLLEINLFGTCIARSMNTADKFEITGSKHKALLALLVTAANGRRARGFLQETLWLPSQFDSGSQNLRRALSDLKKIMGHTFSELFHISHSEIAIETDKVRYLGRPGSGVFLEGIGISHPLFERWLNSIRENPKPLYALYNLETSSGRNTTLPSITVLPFPLIVGDPDNAILGDWLAEEICRSLSRSNLVSVISHLSSRALAKRTIEIGVVRSAFNVDYCVSGSLRVVGTRMIPSADLIDAWSGKILWTRTFDHDCNVFLAASSTGIAEIVGGIGYTIVSQALEHISERPLNDLQHHQMLVAGVGLMHQLTLSSFARSREIIREVIRNAPDSAEAYAWLAEWHVLSVFNGWSTDQKADTKHARAYSGKALELDPGNAFCVTTDGVVQNNLLNRHDTAGNRFDQAVSINPNQATAWLSKGVLHAYRDEAEEAVAAADKARQLPPLDPFQYFFDSLSSTAYLAAEDYDRALDFAEKSLSRNRNELSSLRVKISALHHLDRKADAKIAAKELLQRQPGFNLKTYLKDHPAADHRIGQNMVRALRVAGLT